MTGPVTGDSAAATPSEVSKTTTGKILWVLCVLLLVATTVVFGTSLWVFQREHSTIEVVRTKTVPAILEVLAAQEALVKADGAAVDSFLSEEVKLSGPGLQHQNQLTFASQRLVQVAENNAAGKDGSQRIQLLEALLESYSSLIGQAHAHFGAALGTADLWYASHLLHAGDNPILPELDRLRDDQIEALNRQLAASSTTTGNLLTWVTPIALLLVLLVATQVFLKRRFRRAVNLWLVLAVIGLSTVPLLALFHQGQLESYPDTLARVVPEWKADISAADAQAQQTLKELVTKECKGAKGGCGPTVDQFVSSLKSATGTAADASADKRIREFNDDINKASSNTFPWFAIPLTAGLVAVCIPIGLWPRIEEYRYRPR